MATTMTVGEALARADGAEANAHGVSWPAILAGAAAAAALSLVLLVLGAGLGLASVSPWSIGAWRDAASSGEGTTPAVLGGAAVAWLIATSIAASALGGYLAGRLRARWSVSPDEAWFRDTAHGLVAWSVATLVTAATLTTAVGGIVGTGVRAGGAALAAGGGAVAAGVSAAGASARGGEGGASELAAYFGDQLFRRETATAAAAGSASSAPATAASAASAAFGAGGAASGAASGADAPGSADAGTASTASRPATPALRGALDPADRLEAARIVARGVATGELPAGDASYLASLVQQRTGLGAEEAQRRVTDVVGRAQRAAAGAADDLRRAADAARKATAAAALWMFAALLAGAFFASLAAAFGGRHRDRP